MPEIQDHQAVLLRGQPATEVAIGHHDRHVVMCFPNPTTWVKLDAEQALAIAQNLAGNGFELKHGVAPPDALKRAVTERDRQMLINRITLIVRSLSARQKDPAYIAQTVVDTCLSKVA